ncbi:uncharacterized protein LOC130980823 [Arachis stenosperma]|uniref:uncharacterized protein LOC130980823 n=1 Tax=Arachis stenosperma TaxID=217475 RepID=UPI0025ACF8E9|nr:uncharacterized protein LOC130980823 [Arachis stenosperma]
MATTSPNKADTWFQAMERSLVAEECVKKAAAERGSHKGSIPHNRGKNFAPRGSPFKRRGSFRRPNNNNSHGKRFGKQPQNEQACARCGGHHLGAPCKARWGLCYSCGKEGHKAANCVEKQKQGAGKAHQTGRVFTTSAIGAEGSETLIRGNYEMAGQTLNVLFDSGATYSFIAFEKASELGLKIVVSGYDLKVHNATYEAMIIRLGCPQDAFRFKQHDFFHNLIFLPMIGLDLILELDWLSENHVLLDCSTKIVCFMPEDIEGPVVIETNFGCV